MIENYISYVANNFEPYSYQITEKILIKKFHGEQCFKEDSPTMVVVAGPNASGKSTYIANLYNKTSLNIPYVNADLINKLDLKNIKDENKRNIIGMNLAVAKVEEFIREKRSFIYETVLSHPSKLELIQKAKDSGFEIISIFVYTESPEINLRRLKLRVLDGGHDVPEDKLRNRYYRSLLNKNSLKELSNYFIEYNNSKELTMEQNENNIFNI